MACLGPQRPIIEKINQLKPFPVLGVLLSSEEVGVDLGVLMYLHFLPIASVLVFPI